MLLSLWLGSSPEAGGASPPLSPGRCRCLQPRRRRRALCCPWAPRTLRSCYTGWKGGFPLGLLSAQMRFYLEWRQNLERWNTLGCVAILLWFFFCFTSLGVFLDMFRHGYDTDPSGLRVCRLGFENTPALCILKVLEVTSNRLIQSQLTPKLPHTMHDANWHWICAQWE